ncbi:Cobalt transport CbiM [Gossypium arboreum]|uniref:Cobalt transport CbiM n=1 Tax=Gossypium arboreum TaxID=29729 RepID=A0A0B0PI17_GOSAR|nr:Cobalt transport CbiM [Gossypium arboreum]
MPYSDFKTSSDLGIIGDCIILSNHHFGTFELMVWSYGMYRIMVMLMACEWLCFGLYIYLVVRLGLIWLVWLCIYKCVYGLYYEVCGIGIMLVNWNKMMYLR